MGGEVCVAVLQPGEAHHEEGEDAPNADDDAIAGTGGKDLQFVRLRHVVCQGKGFTVSLRCYIDIKWYREVI